MEEIELVDVGHINSGVIDASLSGVGPRRPMNVYIINQYFLGTSAINSHDRSNREEEERKFANWKSTVKDSNGYIAALITILFGGILKFKPSSPNILLIINMLVYFGSCVVMTHETRDSKTEFGEFMYKISLLIGTLAVVQELFILYPIFGLVALYLWIICFVIAASKSYGYSKRLCLNGVARLRSVLQQQDVLIMIPNHPIEDSEPITIGICSLQSAISVLSNYELNRRNNIFLMCLFLVIVLHNLVSYLVMLRQNLYITIHFSVFLPDISVCTAALTLVLQLMILSPPLGWGVLVLWVGYLISKLIELKRGGMMDGVGGAADTSIRNNGGATYLLTYNLNISDRCEFGFNFFILAAQVISVSLLSVWAVLGVLGCWDWLDPLFSLSRVSIGVSLWLRIVSYCFLGLAGSTIFPQ